MTSTRTEPTQATMKECPQCHILFPPRKRPSKFCGDKCKAAYNREHGIEGTSVSARRLKTRVSITIHTTDDRVLAAPLGTKWQLVKI